LARKVVQDLKLKGRVVRGFLGVNIQTVTESDAKDLDLKMGGVLIIKVEDNSPAQKAGLKKYDLIIAVNQENIKTADELKVKIANLSPGDTIGLTLFRGDQKKNINVKVGEAPESEKFRSEDDQRSMDLGMVLVENSPAVAREYELKTSKGLLVKNVERNGVAYENSVREGDVIIAVNRSEIDTVEEFRTIITQKEHGSSVFLYVNRFGEEFFLKFSLPE
jgi:serine protease Do